MAEKVREQNRYLQLVEKIFFSKYRKGATSLLWQRIELENAATSLGIKLPKNLGDVIYALRYRTAMPGRILALQPPGMEWIIEGVGRSEYAFRLVRVNRIVPNPALAKIKVPDGTPEIIGAYALSDEQALLAKVRYNRLIDIFVGLAAYSLQNHLRTSVKGVGQIEIDEVYVGIDRHGRQFIFPVQAKGGSDQLSVVQAKQDIACCKEKFPGLICRAISAQFMASDLIAMFELCVEDDEIKIVDEKHYQLVAARDISSDELAVYQSRQGNT